MTFVAPRIVNDVSYLGKINHEIDFACQAQYLVKLESHFWTQFGHCSLGRQHVIYDIIWISQLAFLSFGPAIVGSLLEATFIDSSLAQPIVGSLFLSMCIACLYTRLFAFICHFTMADIHVTLNLRAVRSTQHSCTYIFCLTSF